MTNMRVIKRNGNEENVQFDKITKRISHLLQNLDDNIDATKISQQVCSQVHDGINTSELDELSANICMSMSMTHPDYAVLAGRIVINNYQKNTDESFTKTMVKLYNNISHGQSAPLVSEEVYDLSKKYEDEFNSMLQHDRDYLIDFFGFKTLLRAYLLKVNKVPIERMQHMWLRVSIGIHGNDMDNITKTYNLLSQKMFTHATPTLFHSGTPRPQMSSCFLLGTEDSVQGIYKTITDCAMISKWAGGIGVHISNIRANDAYIRKTGGRSDGIMPMLRVYNNTARYINQSGKRNGSFAMYIEPWHADIFDFLDAKKNHGDEEERARDLFYAMWIPDLFMKRVEADDKWSLMCPDTCKTLTQVYGDQFEKLYESYESSGNYIKQIKARDVWNAIINSQIETGTPYMLYKDACNKKSNQKNIGTIKSSNLCTEIIEYSDNKEYAVCNLASLNLTACVKKNENHSLRNTTVKVYTKSDCVYCKLAKSLLQDYGIEYTETEIDDLSLTDFKTVPQIFSDQQQIGGYQDLLNILRYTFDFDLLENLTYEVTKNLNKVIDRNYYPLPETKLSNMRHRPVGIGVQGLADVFMKMKYAFDGEEARVLNRKIFEVIYYGALNSSCDLAKEHGPYESYDGSPISKGILQFDMWDKHTELSDELDWIGLRTRINDYGVRNSLLVAPMPTASTSQILGNNECFEPYTSNLYNRRTLAGEFTIINRWLINDLINMGMWNQEMKEKIMYYRGSIQKIGKIPKFIKDIYKTAWEIKQKVLINMSIDRGHFICQSQSLNIFAETPTYGLLTNVHFYGWKGGLKTGSYYIRSKSAINSQQFTINPELKKKIEQEEQEEECLMCGS